MAPIIFMGLVATIILCSVFDEEKDILHSLLSVVFTVLGILGWLLLAASFYISVRG